MTNPTDTAPAPSITWYSNEDDRLEDAWGQWYGETPDGAAWYEVTEDADGWTVCGTGMSADAGPYATAEEGKTAAEGYLAAWRERAAEILMGDSPITWDGMEGSTPEGATYEIDATPEGYVLIGTWVSDGYAGPWPTLAKARDVAETRERAWRIERADIDDRGCA